MSVVILALLLLAAYKGMGFAFKNEKIEGKTIVIDAGHGGKDPGTVSLGGIYEKDINLDISKKLSKKLKLKGYRVILTRDTDDFVANLERAKVANRENVSLFISIHCNAAENNSYVHGLQVLHYPNKEINLENTNNSQWAQIMLDSIIKSTGAADRGIVERGDLTVLKRTNMPALIIESGFLSNLNEERLLIKASYQDKIVDGIVEALESYYTLNTQ